MVLRALTLCLLMVLAGRACAQVFPCPLVSFGWSQTWKPPSTVTSASYDSAAQVLYITLNAVVVEAYTPVPFGVIQSFTTTPNPYQLYTQVRAQYNQILLNQKQNCPTLQQNGQYVFSNKVPLNFFVLLLQENRRPILQESNNYLYVTAAVPPYIVPDPVISQENDFPILTESLGYILSY